MEKEILYLSVKDYTEDPGPRYKRQDLPGENTSGEMFYVQKLNAAFVESFTNHKKLVLLLDGVSGYPSSFLDEAIGELVYDFTLDNVKATLSFETVMFKRRAKQVLDETYPQWEEKRKDKVVVVHSDGINATLKKLDDSGNIVEYNI